MSFGPEKMAVYQDHVVSIFYNKVLTCICGSAKIISGSVPELKQ